MAILGILAQAATLERLSLTEMIAKSTDIVRAQVSGSRTAYRGSVIYTYYRVDVLERWKGQTGPSFEVAVPGGSSGTVHQTFPGAPRLSSGTGYVLFLWTGPSGMTQVTGLSQGVLTLHQEASGETVASRAGGSDLMLDANGHRIADNGTQIKLSDLRNMLAQAGQ